MTQWFSIPCVALAVRNNNRVGIGLEVAAYNRPMISREPTLERLAIAQQLLIEPFGLDEAKLANALGVMGEHRIDDADLYFQITRHEGWSLEEGIVKSGSFSIDQGVGVRAVAGEKTAFAYSDDISEASLLDAARTVRSIAAAGQSRRVKVGRAPKIATSRALSGDLAPRAHMTLLAKDTGLAVAMAQRGGFAGPLGEKAAAVFAQALQAGLGGLDDAAVFNLLRGAGRPDQ